MSNDYDIEMSLDDTLELDTIIKESNIASTPINNITHNRDNSSHKTDLTNIQTHTCIFDPPKPGEYKIDINNQILNVKVNDPTMIRVEDFEDQSIDLNYASTGWTTPSNLSITSNSIGGDYSLKTSKRINSYTEIDYKPKIVEFDWKGVLTGTGSLSAGNTDIRIEDSEGSFIAGIELNIDDTPEGSDSVYQPEINGKNTMGGSGTIYNTRFEFDWNSGTFDVFVDDSLEFSDLSINNTWNSKPMRLRLWVESEDGNDNYLILDNIDIEPV